MSTKSAGRRRRALWAQNRPRRMVEVRDSSRHSNVVIRKPDRTKNTSTPRSPPPTHDTPKWKRITAITAKARIPSSAAKRRRPDESGWIWASGDGDTE